MRQAGGLYPSSKRKACSEKRLCPASPRLCASRNKPHPASPLAPTRQFLVFRLGDEEYGLPITAVDEVAAAPGQNHPFAENPRKFLEGVVNLRGDVLPIINQRRRFEMPDYTGPAGRQRLIVVRTQRHRAGLRVDEVSGVLTTAEDRIDAAPGLKNETTTPGFRPAEFGREPGADYIAAQPR